MKENKQIEKRERSFFVTHLLFPIAIGVAIGVFASLASSCSPRIIENVRTEVQYRDRIVRDSLYLRDSIYISEKVKGDTVFMIEYREHWSYKDRFVHDTTYVAQHDTTRVPVEVPAKLTRIQQAKLDSYGFILLALVGLLCWTFRKPLLALLRRLIA